MKTREEIHNEIKVNTDYMIKKKSEGLANNSKLIKNLKNTINTLKWVLGSK